MMMKKKVARACARTYSKICTEYTIHTTRTRGFRYDFDVYCALLAARPIRSDAAAATAAAVKR